jgi:hypothetical protein
MKIVIIGGTGFIGSSLLQFLSRQAHDIVVLTRGASRGNTLNASTVRYIHWNASTTGEWEAEIENSNVVINLAGKNIFDRRWNNTVKEEILNSRVLPVQLIVDAMAKAERKPALFLSVSAVGFYGNRNDEVITEESTGGNDFLSKVVQQWESAAYEAERFGVRVATPRIGLVLQKNGGMIGKMLLPFQCFVGGPVGNGKRYLPWIHMVDVVRGLLYPVLHETFRGRYNLVSPNPVTMKEFARTLGSVLHRPAWLTVPEFALALLYGEGANAILAGQHAIPKKLIDAGFRFSFTDLTAALNNILH